MKSSKNHQIKKMATRCQHWTVSLLVTVYCVFLGITSSYGQVLTLPLDQRPDWLKEEGLVMAGSWEPLTYRTLQGTSIGHEPTPEEWALWEKEHSPEVTQKLKDLGVNFIMMHCYKGAGLEIEQKTMDDAARFAKQYREAGLRVGVYTFSGAFLWEPFYRENIAAQNWVLLDGEHQPIVYGKQRFRYYWNRNHPDAQAFYKNIVDFAVNEIKADLLHFDNYCYGPGTDANSVNRFREYLRNTFTSEQLEEMGASDLSLLFPPKINAPQTMLHYAWLRFSSESFAQSYKEMGQYARSMRKDILLELNISEGLPRWIDYGRQFQGGEASWSEGYPSGYSDGKYNTRILNFKIARNLNNMLFTYARTPLCAAESMAFNLDCFGMVCGFENGEITSGYSVKNYKVEEVIPYVKFNKSRRELFANTTVNADVAVLRSYSSQIFSNANAQITSRVEQYCVDNRIPFQIIYDSQLSELNKYRALALAGCVSLSDEEVRQILDFVRQGGRLCIIGPVATHNEWMVQRRHDVFADVAKDQIVRTETDGDIGRALLLSAGGRFSRGVTGREGLFAEYTSTPKYQMVHLVNFRPELPVKNAKVSMVIPKDKKVKSVRLASPDRNDDQPVKFTKKSDEIFFTVPGVDTYSIAIVDFD